MVVSPIREEALPEPFPAPPPQKPKIQDKGPNCQLGTESAIDMFRLTHSIFTVLNPTLKIMTFHVSKLEFQFPLQNTG